jgi:hypothetical protein
MSSIWNCNNTKNLIVTAEGMGIEIDNQTEICIKPRIFTVVTPISPKFNKIKFNIVRKCSALKMGVGATGRGNKTACLDDSGVLTFRGKRLLNSVNIGRNWTFEERVSVKLTYVRSSKTLMIKINQHPQQSFQLPFHLKNFALYITDPITIEVKVVALTPV